jgi:predicted RNase H-like HicB family nuclease
MTLKVILRPGEDNWIVAECPALPGCVSQGRTEGEALTNVREAIELWVETELAKRVANIPPNAKVLELTL